MLVNEAEAPVRERLAALSGEAAFYARVGAAVRAHSTPFQVAADRAGLDLGADNPIAGRPNRARLKVFPLSRTKLAVFFYKPSLLPFSRDRFGYGGRAFEPAGVTDEEIRRWLDYVANGLPAAGRPPDLMRGFPYDVPA